MTRSDPRENRSVCIPQPMWEGLAMIAQLGNTSISEVLRRAGMTQLERHGLSIVDGELTINPLLWPTKIHRGGPNPRRRRIQPGGGPQGPTPSTREAP